MSEAKIVRVVGFAGSTRVDSLNKKLVAAVLEACERHGVETTFIDLKDYPLPLYDGDLEAAEGLPDSARRLREVLSAHDGMIIASPEYNGSISGLLKNTIDWASRSPKATPDLRTFQGKFAAVVAASPGPLGGMRGLRVIRELLTNIGVNVLATQMSLRGAHAEFADDGSLVQESRRNEVERVARELAEVLQGSAATGRTL